MPTCMAPGRAGDPGRQGGVVPLAVERGPRDYQSLVEGFRVRLTQGLRGARDSGVAAVEADHRPWSSIASISAVTSAIFARSFSFMLSRIRSA